METSDDPRSAVALAHAWAAAGEKGKAEKMLRDLEHNAKAMASPYTMATIYAGLGENDRALESLGRPAWRSRSTLAGLDLTSFWIACVPILDFRIFFVTSAWLDMESRHD